MTKEELQKEWDTLLIQAWYCEYENLMSFLAKNFKAIHGCGPFEFGLERTGPDWAHDKLTVRRYICGYMPKFAQWLFETKDKHRALEVIGTRKPLDAPIDESKRMAQRKELVASNSKYKTALHLKQIFNDHWESHKKSNQWGICK